MLVNTNTRRVRFITVTPATRMAYVQAAQINDEPVRFVPYEERTRVGQMARALRDNPSFVRQVHHNVVTYTRAPVVEDHGHDEDTDAAVLQQYEEFYGGESLGAVEYLAGWSRTEMDAFEDAVDGWQDQF